MAQVPNWPWVRTQVHPEACRAAHRVRQYVGWTLPGVYAAMLHYMLLRHSPEELASLIREALQQPPEDAEEE